MTWMLRRATADDLPAIMAIETSTFETDAWSPQTMAGELAGPHGYYLVAVRVDEPTVIDGYAGLLAPHRSADGDIQTIAVAASARRRGLGRTLMRQLLTEARQRGVEQVFLDVRADNPGAQALYEQLGFEAIAVREKYYQPDGVDAVVMRLRITEPAAALAEHRGLSSAQSARIEARPAGGALVLGIETSCDETGVGIVRGTRLLANVIASSMEEHARYGGVVPEIAARAHLEALTPTLTAALDEAGVTLQELDAIAVTSGPGLSGALMVGIGAAKALAVALDKPLYAVNHLVGHVGADILSPAPTPEHAPIPEHTPVPELVEGPGTSTSSATARIEAPGTIEYPTIALLVSGGHTSLLLVRDLIDDVELLGETIDDAAGEAFDKVARLLGLPYPGGPQIDRLAASGDPAAIRFPRGLSLPKDMQKHRYDFSFSGLKTAVARWVEQRRDAGDELPLADVAASFREAVADVLLTKAIAACLDHGVPRLLLGGGVVANARVRQLAEERCAEHGIELRVPPLSLCTDNGAMIAALGAQLVQAERAPSTLGFGADSTLPVTTVQA